MTEAKVCTLEPCGNPHYAHGLCNVHYMRLRRTGRTDTPTRAERFVAKIEVDPVTGCWLWTGALSDNGYGAFNDGDRLVGAHRWSYKHFVGPIPDELEIDHQCHNADASCAGGVCRHRRCVCPEHLTPATSQENVVRGRRPGQVRAITHCPAGHPYDAENTRITSLGYRRCRACHRASEARRRAAR